MRRHDREMSREFGLEVIDKSQYGILSCVDDKGVFAIPLSLVRKDENLYFHSAKQGRKVEAFKKTKDVHVTFVGIVEVPNLYTDEKLDKMLEDPRNSSVLAKNVFTTQFESAIVLGTIDLVEDETEKAQAFRLICNKFVPSKAKYVEHAIKSGMPIANVYRIKINDITAKRKKYDSHGEEMKFQRMEWNLAIWIFVF